MHGHLNFRFVLIVFKQNITTLMSLYVISIPSEVPRIKAARVTQNKLTNSLILRFTRLPLIYLVLCKRNTGLFEMIVGVLTTCHTQYT